MSKILTLKGRKEGVMLCVTEGYNFEEFFQNFKELIGTENSFFVGGKIVGIEGIQLSDREKERFLDFIHQSEAIELLSFEYSPKTKDKDASEKTSLAENEISLKDDKNKKSMGNVKLDILEKIFLEEEEFMSDSLFFRGTVRSGVKLESEKNIIVVGDVNPGAELIAKSNIVVLGKLKGFAHAGADGSVDKIIAAWKLQPTQIRIGDYITMPPEGELDEDIDYPEMAIIEDGRVIIKSYQ